MIAYCLYSILCQLCFYIAYSVGLKQESDFQWNRFFLLASLMLSLVLPLLQGWGIQEEVYITPMMLPDVSVSVSRLAADNVGNELIRWTPIVWGVVSCLVLAITLFRLKHLFKIIKEGRKERGQGYTMVYVADNIPTCSFGPYVLWPKSQSVQAHQAILLHELAHVRERHTFDVLFINLLHIVFWMNPMIWLYGRELKSQHEFLADRKAAVEASPEDYIRLLVQSIFKQTNLGYVHSFHESNIKTRIKMIKSLNKTVISWRKIGSALALAALVGVSIACTENADSAITEKAPAPITKDKTAALAETPASIEGGMSVLFSKLGEHLKYPEQAKKLGIEGKVLVSFVVDTNGEMTDFKVVKGIGAGCDNAAVEALKATNIRWIPARDGDNVVKQQLTLPINFKFKEEEH